MISLRWKLGALCAFLLTANAAAQIGPGPFAAFPTDDETDARFLTFGCPGIATFEQGVTMGLAAPADAASFTLSIFDGETGEGGSQAHWDSGNRQLIYRLYADPLRQGSTAPTDLIGTWTGNDPNPMSGPLWTATATDMPDNDWWGLAVTTSASAKSPSGNFFYNLTIEADGICNVGELLSSSIKVASTSPMSFLIPRFGLEAALHQAFNDGPIIYPGPTFPPPGNDFVNAPTTYDGTFSFSFVLPGGEPDLELFNGDFDHGTNVLVGLPSGTVLDPCFDSDDPDTPATYTGFPFSTAGALPEAALPPGLPPDDNHFDFFRRGEVGSPGRVGCVRYEVTDPNGVVYRDDNPSGNLEWEQFRIASLSAVDPSNSDYLVNAQTLPAGIWTVKIIGLDLANLNFWFANTCSSVNGDAACPTSSVYLVGDTVWFDTNGDSDQDPGEAGISGVVLELLTDIGSPPVQTVTTGDTSSPNWAACVASNTGLDEQGLYCLGVDQPGTYIVRVAAENFQPGGALEGMASTTGGETQTNGLDNGNVLTYDFGYRGTASLGDRVWLDTDGDEDQDSGEDGINGVTVELLDDESNVIDSTTTAGDGNYSFTELAAGTYSVRIVTSTLPAGLAPTFDLDGTGTPHIATADLGPGENRTDVDFGYRGTASIGDRVWQDTDGGGDQDGGEPGINGVTVQLLDGDGNVAATDTTSGDGNYQFTDLTAGTYTVRIVNGTLPPGYVQTYDLDGTGTAHTATATLTAGQNRVDVDFGYRAAPVCTTGAFKDTFTTASFSNNDGTLAWSDAWVEYDVAGTGVNSGNVTVGTPVSGYLILRDSPDTGTQPSAARQANLAGYASATLTVDFHIRGVEADDAAVIEVSNNGGTSYTVLETLTGYTGTYISSRTFSISAYMSSNTRIRFRISNNYGGDDDFFKVDVVRIDASCTAEQTGSIGDRVWKDADADGVQDSGETGINGVTVQLLNSSDTVIATQVTSGDGNYSFTGLAAGTYKVKVVSSTLPSGYVQTYDLDGTGTAHTATATLTTGQNRTDVDFGYRAAPSCTAGYFKDAFSSASFSNNDGTLSWSGAWIEYDAAGTGVSSGNVTVGTPVSGYMILRDSPDTGTQPSAARQMNLTGYASATLTVDFHIRGVESDDAAVIEVSNNGGTSYTALETLTGYTGTYISSRTFNISAYIASNTRIRFRISNNYGGDDDFFKVDVVRIDAGCTTEQTGSIGNRVWKDTDADGVQDSGETGINGVTVQLLNSSDTVLATQTTSGDGSYSFTGLAAGTYKVKVVSSTLPSGYVQTYDLDGTATAHVAAASLTASQNRIDVDFGYRAAPVCTAGYFKDTFSTASFSNNNGTLSWSGIWVESDVAGTGVSSGNVTVGTPVSGYLILRDSPDTGTQPSAARQANLAGYASATLTVDFHIRGVESDDAVFIEVSNNGGTSYAVLETLTGYTGTYISSRTFNISAYMASNTRIRFRISNNYGGSDDFFKVDVVKIDAGCTPQEQPGTGTIGYWKNHSEDWPVEQITVGGKSYTKSQAIGWLGTSSSGDKTIDLFKQLVAAKLNVLIGNDPSCISSTISSADAWLVGNPLGSGVSGSSSTWSTGGPLHTKLDDYNNGRLCAPHRD